MSDSAESSAVSTSEQQERAPKERGKGGGKRGKAGNAGASSTEASGTQGGQVDTNKPFSFNKVENFPAWYEAVLVYADIMDKRYDVKGMPVFTPYGYYMHNKIMTLLEEQWEAQGIEKVQFPILVPYSYLEKEKEHIRGFSKEVFWVTRGGEKEFEQPMAMRPTSETAMYTMFSKWVQSIRDLPLKVHQTCCVYRYETKSTLPLIRAREIFWNEAHTCHATPEDALETLEDAWRAYLWLLEDQMGVYGLRLRRPVWDKFAGAEHTDVLDVTLPSGKVLQSVGAHYLGQKFSTSFDIKFLNRSNEQEHAYMTCYGVSTRMLASMLAAHGDEKGLVLPPKICKIQIVIIPIIMKDKEEAVVQYCEHWLSTLKAAGFRVYLDDGRNKTNREKFQYWEVMGVPLRMELGPRDAESNKVCLFKRNSASPKDKKFVDGPEAVDACHVLLEELDAELHRASKAFHEDHIRTCMTMDEVADVIEKNGGFARIPFHTDGPDGKEAEALIHERCGAEIRGFIPTESAPEEGTLCIVTGQAAKVWAYVARSY